MTRQAIASPVAERLRPVPCRPFGGRVLAAGLSLLLAVLAATTQAQAQAQLADAVHLVQVVAPAATCAAVSDAAGLLIVGQAGQSGHHLAVFRLDEAGNPGDAPAQQLALPRPEALANFANQPLALALHPALPLLYVWQDIAAPAAGSPEAQAVLDQFDHLVIYALKDGQLEQVGALSRGPDFAYGQTAAALALSRDGKRLFLPHLQDPAAGAAGKLAVGYFDLDEAGMPQPVPVPIPGTLDGYGLEKFDLRMQPRRVALGAYLNQPVGEGLAALTPAALLMAWPQGVAVWDVENRRAGLGQVFIRGVGTRNLIAAHPALPVVYGATHASPTLFVIAHTDGYPSLLPQVHTISGASFRSAPVVAAKGSRLAIGGVNLLHLLGLDDQGRITGEQQATPVSNPNLRALTYSAKHDRLYVPVESKAP